MMGNYDLGWAVFIFGQRVLGFLAGAAVVLALVLAALAGDAPAEAIPNMLSWAGALLTAGFGTGMVAAIAQVIIEEVEDDD